jgi:hypothetical protein
MELSPTVLFVYELLDDVEGTTAKDLRDLVPSAHSSLARLKAHGLAFKVENEWFRLTPPRDRDATFHAMRRRDLERLRADDHPVLRLVT